MAEVATTVVVSLVKFPSLLIDFDATFAKRGDIYRLQCKWSEATFHQVHSKCQADICRLRRSRLDVEAPDVIDRTGNI